VSTFDESRFYSASEVWRLSNAPRRMVYDALASGELASIARGLSGRRYLIPGQAVLAWIESLEGGDESVGSNPE
jgi:excisionase family DNA binding protein